MHKRYTMKFISTSEASNERPSNEIQKHEYINRKGFDKQKIRGFLIEGLVHHRTFLRISSG